MAGNPPPGSDANGAILYLIIYDLLSDHESPLQAPVQRLRQESAETAATGCPRRGGRRLHEPRHRRGESG